MTEPPAMLPSAPWKGPDTLAREMEGGRKDGGSRASLQGSGMLTDLSNATDTVLPEQLGRGLGAQSALPSKRPATSVTSVSPLPLAFLVKIWPFEKPPRPKATFVSSGDQAHSNSSPVVATRRVAGGPEMDSM